jgi:hypothetical protein
MIAGLDGGHEFHAMVAKMLDRFKCDPQKSTYLYNAENSLTRKNRSHQSQMISVRSVNFLVPTF